MTQMTGKNSVIFFKSLDLQVRKNDPSETLLVNDDSVSNRKFFIYTFHTNETIHKSWEGVYLSTVKTLHVHENFY